MPSVADRVRETTTTTGTGTVNLEGAVTGFQLFSAAFSTGTVVYYCISDGTNWEIGYGAVTTGSPWTLARSTVLQSSNADALVNFGAGIKDVFCTMPAQALDTHAATSKTTPVDADEIPLSDSAADFGLKKLTWANADATLKTYFDSVTTTLTNKTLTSPVISGGTINNASVGATTPSTGAFTSLSASSPSTVSANSTSAALTVTQTGTGNAFVVEDSASTDSTPFAINTNGDVGIGANPTSSNARLAIGGAHTGNSVRYGSALFGTTSSDVTSSFRGFISSISTEAASFTIGEISHFLASQGTIGAGSSVTTQHGFLANNSLTGATNNYGFYGNIPAGTGRWNFYAVGTADNAYAGNSSFGQVAAPIAAVDTTSFATNIVTNTTSTYTVLTSDYMIIQTTAASTYTLPAAASFTGRRLHILTQFAGTVISASANVVPIAGGAAGTAILAATAGKYAILQSNGTNWLIVAAN